MRRKMTILIGVVVMSLLISTPAAAAPAQRGPSAPVWSAPGYHLVRAGETVFSIGRLYGVSPWAIASANHLPNADMIYVGQWLYVPSGYARYGCGFYHWVRTGQTLHSIGRSYGVSPWTIAAANGIYNLDWIYAGQRLFIPCYR